MSISSKECSSSSAWRRSRAVSLPRACCASTRFGRWTTPVDEWPVPYVHPQASGNRTGVRWLRFCDADGHAVLTIDQLDGLFWIERLSRLKRERLIKRYQKLGGRSAPLAILPP